MKAEELRAIQDDLKFDAPTIAILLCIPYNTYRNYIYGENAIPEDFAKRVLDLQKREKQLDERRLSDYDEFLNKSFPHGFLSEKD